MQLGRAIVFVSTKEDHYIPTLKVSFLAWFTSWISIMSVSSTLTSIPVVFNCNWSINGVHQPRKMITSDIRIGANHIPPFRKLQDCSSPSLLITMVYFDQVTTMSDCKSLLADVMWQKSSQFITIIISIIGSLILEIFTSNNAVQKYDTEIYRPTRKRWKKMFSQFSWNSKQRNFDTFLYHTFDVVVPSSFGGNQSLLYAFWYPIFRLLEVSALGFKARVDPLSPAHDEFNRFISGATPAGFLQASMGSHLATYLWVSLTLRPVPIHTGDNLFRFQIPLLGNPNHLETDWLMFDRGT